ncbi:MAG: response regulator [Spirochaetaceae bacterium]|jgi:putative two-component system response regulator|nr:response regulator [Spirochaetaceae bacterium]
MESAKSLIALVDDDVTSLALGKNIMSGTYDVVTIPSGEKLFRFLDKALPDLILLDVEMPEMNGHEVLARLKAQGQTAGIPVIFLTSMNDVSSEIKGLNLGAIDYISKPFSPPLLLKRLELHIQIVTQQRELINYNSNLQEMVKARTKTILDMQNSVLKIVANMVESRDEITGGHVERTRAYLGILLDGLSEQGLYASEIAAWDRDFFLQSSQLHDVGKIRIPDSILMKPDKLTAEEFEQMKKHTLYGVQIIEAIQKDTPESDFLSHAKILAGYHHEKWNGQGYPYGLAGPDIPLGGRLMAIADVYDALISTRPYKAPLSHGEAAEIIIDGKGAQFDPDLIDVFITVSGRFDDMVRKLRGKSA